MCQGFRVSQQIVCFVRVVRPVCGVKIVVHQHSCVKTAQLYQRIPQSMVVEGDVYDWVHVPD